MALSAPFSLQDVYDEFHPLYVQNSMRWMYEAVFGTPSSGGKLSDFDGYGQPVVTRTGDSADSDSITVNIDVTTNGTTTYVRIQANPASDPSIIETSGWVSKSNGSTTVTLGGLDDQTEYSYRIHYYNKFGTSTYYEQSSAYSQTTQQGTLSPPSLDSITGYSIGRYTIIWSISGEIPTGLSFEYRVNGGAWNTNAQTYNFNNSSTPYDVEVEPNALPNPNDYYEFRAKATKSGYNTSGYSNTIGYQH